ncbi:Phage late control gene D protein (GPD) [Pseudovibrio axinellae]|uniref:Phage late control gene D protein (GPD) n=1 Tax=Pseudovibrio axinellae TaxID=989403 RepID=A0A165WSA6_9HYPH|nr:hypothetical protein [Pseudovibrio axinellae]KZL16836.1 Phage late control gene D protein (GPD) [Pseudovibrio axinellae]SER67416.1 hypothetical protein SAMN05421798_1168 [Pseudovibrio axinellae]
MRRFPVITTTGLVSNQNPICIFLGAPARRHGALFSIKDGRLVFAKKGSGTSASGKELPVAVISKQQIINGTCRVHFGDRSRDKSVKAFYRAPNKARRVSVEAVADK